MKVREFLHHDAQDLSSQVRLFNLRQEPDREELEALFADGGVRQVHDTYLEQLRDLIRSRRPDRSWSEEAMGQELGRHLAGQEPWQAGRWAFFPWSGWLVHLLAEGEFAELRLDRNRYKITREEQARLANKHIGIVGLSVGQASALCLATEGVGGTLRLADFDELGLSNLNRLRAGVHELGLPKTVLAARAIYELNPYARLQVFHRGIAEDNLEAFLTSPRPLDLLVEECDDLAMKVRLRERARALGIPVLMDTCDRGLLDIERFDKEPRRPIFHGLLGGTQAVELGGLSTADKVPHVLRILGEEQISERTLATLVEVDQTVSSWPQLASGVTLGAALVCDVARRILLEQLDCSGRYYVDLEQLVAPGAQSPLAGFQPLEVEASPEALRDEYAIPELVQSPALAPQLMRDLLGFGILGISGGNCQPWRFVVRQRELECRLDPERLDLFLDFARSASHLALGSVIENLDLAASRAGLRAQWALFPDAADDLLVARMDFQEGPSAHPRPELVEQIPRRVTNRRLAPRQPLLAQARSDMDWAAASLGAELSWVESEAELEEMGRLLGKGDRLRFLSKVLHAELMSELRWNREEVESSRDGIDILTMELPAADRAALRVAAKWSAMKMVEHIGGGKALEKISRKAVAAASAIGLMRMPGWSPRAFVQGGRAIQRLWLAATAHGLAFQPMTAINFVWSRLERAEGQGLNEKEKRTLRDLRGRYGALLPVDQDHAEIMLFRVASAPPPSARALRRPVEEVTEFLP